MKQYAVELHLRFNYSPPLFLALLRSKRGLYDSLLVHRIPRDVQQRSVQELFSMKTTILPVDFEIFEQTSGTK